MANLKLVKGGKSKEDSDAPDYVNILRVGIIMGVFLGCIWIMMLCMNTVLNNPDETRRFGYQLLKGLSIMYIGIIGISLGKEMTLSSKKHITIFGIVICCLSVGSFFYGGYQWM